MTHYHLVCKTCNVEFLPVVGTTSGELLCMPSCEDTCECCGASKPNSHLVDSVRRFHQEHRGHELIERECHES